MIGDVSSDDEERDTLGSRQSVQDKRNFFERLSKGSKRDHTPDFKPPESSSPVKSKLQTNQSTKQPNKLMALMASNKEREKKRPNIFARKSTNKAES